MKDTGKARQEKDLITLFLYISPVSCDIAGKRRGKGRDGKPVQNLERSFADDRPRALIQMATGSGKTFTAITSTYRLIKFTNARRVLFLVDRANLGRQALKEFQQYVTPDDGRKFTELYNVQHLTSNKLDPVARVCITTNLKRAGRLCQSILKRAFEGELVPQNPKDKPASVLLEHIRTERQAEQKATAKAISKPSQKSKRPQVAETQVELFR